MKFIVKALLGTTVLGGLIGVYFADEARNAKISQQKQENEVVLYFENKDCLKFSMQNAHGTFAFERANFESPWHMISSKKVMADQDEVNNILVSLRNISVQRLLTSDTNLDNYGLSTPLLRFEITLKNKGTKVLSFGSNISGNSDVKFHLPSAYAQVTGRQNILVVDDSLLPMFNSKNYSDFRTKKIVTFKPSDVNEIQIEQQNKRIEITHTENGWSTTLPNSAPGDQNAISSYIQMYEELMADKILEPPFDDFITLTHLNFNNPDARIEFKSKENVLQTLSLYITKSGLYLTMPDGALAQVDLMKWADLVPKSTYFRDRSVLLGMNIKSCKDNKKTVFPQTFLDDLTHLTAFDMIENASAQELEIFGFNQPIRTLTCSLDSKKNSESSESFDILVGNRVPLNEKNVYIKRSDLEIVYIVNTEWLSKLAQLESL